ncbi:MAG: DPP IV N-terminal domain-containing protein [Planctomycetota bacterium]
MSQRPSTQRLLLTLTPAALLLGTLATTTGCSTAYRTPTAGFVTPEHRTAQPAATARAQRVAPEKQVQAQASPASSGQFASPPAQQADAFSHNSAADLVPVASRPAYGAPHGGSPGQFNLYGQFDGNAASRTSSMDAQDNLRRVTFTTEGADFDVESDPSGQWLYFASTRHRETADIYRQKIGGTAVTQLTSDASNDVMPAISPDGKTLAFCSDRAGTWDIYLTDADGGQVIKLTNDDAHNIHPSFSRDGSQLVYSSFGSQSGQWELVLVDLARPTKKRIIGHGLFPVWSPTDDTIVFQRARERGSRWFSVWTVDIVDGEAISPTEIAVSSNAAVITPEWSPDGRNIVFSTVLDPQNDDPSKPAKADVWVINRDGTGRAKLTTGDFANLQPAWSSNGEVYFISDRGVEGIENIWAVRPGQAVYLADSQRQQAAPDVQNASVPTP